MNKNIFNGFDYQHPDADLKTNILMLTIKMDNNKQKKGNMWLKSFFITVSAAIVTLGVIYSGMLSQAPSYVQQGNKTLHNLLFPIFPKKNWIIQNGLLETPKNMELYKDETGSYIVGMFPMRGGDSIPVSMANFKNEIHSPVELYAKPILSYEQMVELGTKTQTYLGAEVTTIDRYQDSIFNPFVESGQASDITIDSINSNGTISTSIKRSGDVNVLYTLSESIDTEVQAQAWIENSWIQQLYDLSLYNFTVSTFYWGDSMSIAVQITPKVMHINRDLETLTVTFASDNMVRVSLPGPVDVLETHLGYTQDEVYKKVAENYGSDVEIIGFEYTLINDSVFSNVIIPAYVVGIRQSNDPHDTYTTVFIGANDESNNLIKKALNNNV